MKSKLSQEMDTWLWRVVESGDPDAIQQFEDRYPEYRAELRARLAMVGSLKVTKPSSVGVPHFRVPAAARPSPWRSRLIFACAACTILAAAYASFTVVRSISTPQQATVTQLEPVETRTFAIEPEKDVVKRDSAYHVLPKINPPAPDPGPNPTPETLAEDARVTVRFERIRLLSALEAIAADGGIQLEIAPNMPDIEIGMEYRNQPVLKVLQHLGEAHGFRLLEQGKNRYLIIPVLNEDPATTPEPGETQPPTGTEITPTDGRLNPADLHRGP